MKRLRRRLRRHRVHRHGGHPNGHRHLQRQEQDAGHGDSECRGAGHVHHLDAQQRKPPDHCDVWRQLGVPHQHVRHPDPDRVAV